MLELATIKQHCRLEPDFTEEDELLAIYLNSARRYVENYTDRTLYNSLEEIPVDADGNSLDEDALVVNDGISTAMLLLVGHWYANREAVVIGTITADVPLAVEALLQPYRIYGV